MHNRRIDDIILIQNELVAAIRVEAEALAEAEELRMKTANASYQPAESVVSETGNQMRDVVDDDMKMAKTLRVEALAVDELGDMLFPYTKDIVRRPMLVTNKMEAPEMWHITLDVPATMGSIDLLRTLAHEYVVRRVIQEWVRICMPARYEAETVRINEVKNRMSAAKDRRVKPVRRRMGM